MLDLGQLPATLVDQPVVAVAEQDEIVRVGVGVELASVGEDMTRRTCPETDSGPIASQVLEARVVLSQEVCAIVTAVRRANDRVDVMPRRRGIVERHTRKMLELDEHDGLSSRE